MPARELPEHRWEYCRARPGRGGRSKARAQSRTGALLYEFHLLSEVGTAGDVEYVTFRKTQTLSQKMETAVKKRMLVVESDQVGDE